MTSLTRPDSERLEALAETRKTSVIDVVHAAIDAIASCATIPPNGRPSRQVEGVGHLRLIWRGEIYDVDLGRPAGPEPAFIRPAVVVSADVVYNSAGSLAVVVPVGSTLHGLRSHVELERIRPGTARP